MKQLLCLAAQPWQRTPTRTQYFLTALAEAFPDLQILYFQPDHPSIRPQRGQQVVPGICRYTLPYIPMVTEAHPQIPAATLRQVQRVLREGMDDFGFQQPLLWVCSPLYDQIVETLPRSGLIYDCDRDWSNLPIELESQLTCRADIVFAASPGLQDHLSPCNHNIVVVPVGIDFPRFDAVRTDGYLCPPELLHCTRPIFGYVGTIWSNLNLTPVQAAAEAHPEWSFVFLGKISRKNPYLPALRRLPNVQLLGSRPQEEIPAYLRHINVGLSLLRDEMEDNDILSPRIYEYFAQGLPVVAMYHHLQKEVYPTLIDSAYSPAGFVQMCEKVICEDPTKKKVARYQLATGADWSCRCRHVVEVLQSSRLLDELDLTHAPDAGQRWFGA